MYFDEAAKVYLYLVKNYSVTEILKKYFEAEYDMIIISIEENLNQMLIEINQKTIYSIEEALIFLLSVDYASEQASIKKCIFERKEPLNTNFREEVAIYYTYSGIERDKKNASTIAVLFKNLLFFQTNIITGARLEIMNYYWHDRINSLNVGFVPYPIADLNYSNKDGMITFSERTKLDDNDLIFLENCRRLADNDSVDILFGPEIHGSPLVDAKLKILAHEKRIKLVFCPSYHYEGYNKSQCYIKENNHDKPFQIKKKYPAQFNKDHLQEGIISPNEFTFNIVHINGFGRVGLIICRDYISDLNILVEHLNLDLILVQCYTPVTSQFLSHMKMNASMKRVVIMGNSCTCLKEEKKRKYIQIGLHLSKSLHGKMDENTKIQDIECSCGDDECYKDNSCYRLFTIKVVEDELIIT